MSATDPKLLQATEPPPTGAAQADVDASLKPSELFGQTVLRDPLSHQQSVESAELPKPQEGSPVRAPDGGEPAPDKPMAFGRFVVRTLLGKGAFGSVYLAYDDQLKRNVAIKAPHRHVLNSQADVDRFLKEARDLAQLRHPAIITVFDVGIEAGQCYIVSDYIEGGDLSTWLKHQKPTWQEACAIVADVADALAHAHARRIVHRDLKPGNILLTEDHKPVVVDFGLAVSESDARDPSAELGMIAGTVNYMSPEQATGRGHRVDGRTDIYSLGVVLYRMLCGRVPFQGATVTETLRQVCHDEPQPPRQLAPKIPREVEAICLKAMSKTLSARYTTAADFSEDLRRALLTHSGSASSQHLSTPVADAFITDNPPHQSSPPQQTAQPSPTISFHASQASQASHATNVPTPDLRPADSVSLSKSSSRRARAAERRQVTMMFCVCDLFESSDFLEEVDAQDQINIQRDYHTLCNEIIAEFDGTLVQSGSEGVLVCFGYPQAHEDSTRRAVRAAVRLQQRVKTLNEDLSIHRVQLAPRIGLHTGQVVIGEATGSGSGHSAISIVGEPRNVVTKLDTCGEPGMIVVTAATKRLTAGHFDFKSIGESQFKGVEKKLELFQVTGERQIVRRIEDAARSDELTPLTGRDLEVTLLTERWEQATEGMGQVVLLIGEAGLGKSRLVYTIKKHVIEEQDDDEHSQLVVEWFCSPLHTHSSFYAARECFERLLKFQPDEAPVARLERLVEHLQGISLDGDEEIALFASLLALPLDGHYPTLEMSPDLQREQTIKLLQDWLRALSSQRPILFIVEDLHWVDPSTLQFLEYHVEQGIGESVLSLLTFRPEFQTPWSSLAHQTQVALNRLTKRQVVEMMQRKARLKHVPEHIAELVIQRTDGVPLFVEEFTTMIMESGSLRDIGDATEISVSFPVNEIPATLQDLLLSRLDRMDSNMEIVQLAAVLGREFSHELICAVSEVGDEELHLELDKLIKAELIFQKGRPPRSIYIFKHALIQDAAYQSLLKNKRRQFHLRAAEVLQDRFPELVESDPALLAHHYTEAGDAEKGIHFWHKAAALAGQKSAHTEAINCVRRGLELVQHMNESPRRDELELSLQVLLGAALVSTRGYAAPEVSPVYDRARELCERVGDKWNSFVVLFGIWAWRLVRDELRQSLEISDQIMALANGLNDPGIMMEAHHVPANSLYYLGDFEAALQHCSDGFALYDEERCRLHCHRSGQNSGVTLQCYWSLALWHQGYPDQALDRIRAATSLAKQLKHPFSQCYSLHFSAWVHQFARLGEAALQAADAEMKLADKHGFAFWSATSRLYRASALLLLDRTSEAVDMAQEGLQTIKATGAKLSLSYYNSFLAEAQRRTGRLDDALRTLDESLEIVERTQNRFYAAELLRLKGELLLEQSADAAVAEDCFQKSLEVARAQKAKSWELRTAMSLLRLRQKQGLAGEGRALLADVYGWFREGFATPDLVDARRLLDDLA